MTAQFLRATTPQQLAAILRSPPLSARGLVESTEHRRAASLPWPAYWGPLLNAPVIELDLLLNRPEGQYSTSLRLNELRDRLAAASGPVVVEGICLLQVLDAVDASCDRLVNVKSMSNWGWERRSAVRARTS